MPFDHFLVTISQQWNQVNQRTTNWNCLTLTEVVALNATRNASVIKVLQEHKMSFRLQFPRKCTFIYFG